MAPRPPCGGRRTGKPVRAFLGQVPLAGFVHRWGYGAPHRPFPFVLARSPPPARRRFGRRLPCGTLHGYSRTAKPLGTGGRPCPMGPGGSRVRTWYATGSRLRLAHAADATRFPLRGSGARGTTGHGVGVADPRRPVSEKGGSRTLPVTGLAIVRPRLWLPGSAGPPVSLGPLVPCDTLSTGQLRTRRGAMGSLPAAGGTRTHFPRPSPRGYDPPGTLSASPNRLAPDPSGMWSAVEPEAVPGRAALSAAPARISPGMRLPRLSHKGLPPPLAVLIRPRRQPGCGFEGVIAGRGGVPQKKARPAQGNLIRLARPPGTACGHGPFCFLWPFCFLSPPSPGDYICL